MTLVRDAARKISSVVVRYASPGCREWAEGLAREMEFIPGDWAALGWAFGSSRVLLDRREAWLTSLADVQGVAQRFSESVRSGAVTRVFLFLWVFVYGLRFLNASGSAEQRRSCCVAVLVAIGLGVIDLIQRRGQQVPETDDVGAWVVHYRSELERQRDFYFSGAARHFDSIVFFLLMGTVFLQDGGARGNLTLVAYEGVVYVVWQLVLVVKRRWFQRRIDELDAMLKEAC